MNSEQPDESEFNLHVKPINRWYEIIGYSVNFPGKCDYITSCKDEATAQALYCVCKRAGAGTSKKDLVQLCKKHRKSKGQPIVTGAVAAHVEPTIASPAATSVGSIMPEDTAVTGPVTAAHVEHTIASPAAASVGSIMPEDTAVSWCCCCCR